MSVFKHDARTNLNERMRKGRKAFYPIDPASGMTHGKDIVKCSAHNQKSFYF